MRASVDGAPRARPIPATFISTTSKGKRWSSPSTCADSRCRPVQPVRAAPSSHRTCLRRSACPSTARARVSASRSAAPTPPSRSSICARSLRFLMPMSNAPIAVAMSGGVDSSTVAALLHQRGRRVIGLTMQLWNQRRFPELVGENATGRCCSLDDVYDARHVAEQIGIPYYVVNFERQFEERVVAPFVEEYLAGRTPVPCTLCNNFIKFDQFLEMADAVDAPQIATGHYARIAFDERSGRYQLRKGIDETKDQTYFLFGLTQAQLARSLFPI